MKPVGSNGPYLSLRPDFIMLKKKSRVFETNRSEAPLQGTRENPNTVSIVKRLIFTSSAIVAFRHVCFSLQPVSTPRRKYVSRGNRTPRGSYPFKVSCTPTGTGKSKWHHTPRVTFTLRFSACLLVFAPNTAIAPNTPIADFDCDLCSCACSRSSKAQSRLTLHV